MKLVTLGLIVFIGTLVNGLPDSYDSKYGKSLAPVYQKSYSESYKYSEGPKVNWAYWINEGLLNQNQAHQRTNFGSVDCNLNKNIIYYEPKNINFGQNLAFEWTDNSEAQKFLTQLTEIKKRCPYVRVVIDPSLHWSNEIADQIVQKKISVIQLAKSITDFNKKYYFDGMVMSFSSRGVVLDDKLTYEFMMELKRSFNQHKLQLILVYSAYAGLSYVRPVAFEFADLILVYTFTDGYDNINTLKHSHPANGAGFRSSNGIIDAFVNMGAHRSQITLSVQTAGITSKRVTCTSDVEAGCPAAGYGSVIYTENTIIAAGKNVWLFLHDRPTVCRVLDDPEWTKKYDSAAQVPYAYNNEQWMSYDDEQSIKVKIDLVKEKGIAGVTIFPLNSDDIYNVCGKGDYSFTRQFVDGFKY